MHIPVVDLFAGPGGLGEGFSSQLTDGTRPFRIAVSVEKDEFAHQTLLLRAFYRWFRHEGTRVPEEYYKHLAGELSLQVLFAKFPKAWESVEKEALCAELGKPEDQATIDTAIDSAVGKQGNWLLIGGPPCQAYSLVGRARMQNAEDYRNKQGHSFDDDHRHKLYREYLRVIAKYSPSVFVMENVKGILSSKLAGTSIFPEILKDLKEPGKAGKLYGWSGVKNSRYHVASFVTGTEPAAQTDYLIRAEEYGIPQMRHRVILLGVRDDVWNRIKGNICALKQKKETKIYDVIDSLPALRSGFSKGRDSVERWQRYFKKVLNDDWYKELPQDLKKEIKEVCSRNTTRSLERTYNGDFIAWGSLYDGWYEDDRLANLPNHDTRSHMDSDFARYLFVSAFGKKRGYSPRLKDFPEKLLPNHKNVQDGINNGKFADRFKVQLWNSTASTITSHISKDGHYFIHPDPAQCRSLTVREAARIQTFPDNYYFEGGRTEQYHQVGNAVPPYLAKQLAEVVWDIFKRI